MTDPAPAPEVPPAPPAQSHLSDRAFADFPIGRELLQGLEAMGYSMATPVQAMTIDPALAGRDLVVRAKTGTGKTSAFGIPTLERIAAGERITRALVLCPTRELALQVAQELAAVARYKDLRIAAIYGGVGFGPQEEALRGGAEVVVGTPGRVLDHLRRGNLDLSRLQVAVLDEADEMLSMGFLEDVRKILDRAPNDRQTLLFSATLSDAVKGLAGKYLREPEEILLSYDGDNVSTVAHILYESSPDYHKARALLDLIEQEQPGSAVIFCNTREDVSTVCTYLERQGLNVEMLSGELPQKQRERVMARVKAGATQFLVATDVAARGIDISDLTHVINYSLPEDAAVYTHRAGRTGRIGKQGVCISLVGGADFSTRLSLERIYKIDFVVKELPPPEVSRKLRTERVARALKDAGGTMTYETWLEVARALRQRPDGDTLIAIALRGFFMWDHDRRAKLAEAAEGGEGGGEAESAERRGERRERRDDRRRAERGGGERRRDERRTDERRSERRREERPRNEARKPEEATVAPPAEAPPAETTAAAGEEADSETAETEPGTPGAGGGEAGSRRRRRRRRRRGGSGGEGGGTAPSADGTAAESSPVEASPEG